MPAATNEPSGAPTGRDNPPLDRERYKLAQRISRALRTPMAILAFVWLVLLVIDLTRGLPPTVRTINWIIWGLFILQFAIEFLVTPRKLLYLRRNWLTAVALVVPAARLFAVFRAVRALIAIRGVVLVQVVGSMNRGMRALGSVMQRRGFKYAVFLSLLVTAAGASGMYAFERGVPGSTITSFGSALWWTAMTLTTMGSDYFPKTPAGRFLCLLLAVYGFAVFGYVTATIASFFVGRDAGTDTGDVAGSKQVAKLERDIAALHQKLDTLTAAMASQASRSGPPLTGG